jgi:NAD(P)H-dependent FMN reductase
MIKLVGFAGSLRAGSFNRALLKAAVDAMPDNASLEALSIDAVPLYNADVEEEQGIPASVATLKDKIAAADGLIIVTPEYNGGIPGIAKNVIDWISRPGALLGATPGGLGTALSQAAWLQVLRTLRMRVWVSSGPFYVSAAHNSFDRDGRASDELKQRLAGYLQAYVESLA